MVERQKYSLLIGYAGPLDILVVFFFLFFVQNNEFFQLSSLEFDFLSRVVCARNTWNSIATAINEILKVEFRILRETAKDYLCQMTKTYIGFSVWLEN